MKLLAAAALAGAALFATTAVAQSRGPLPDFPTDAQPGRCYARVPVGGPAPIAADGQRVWTIEKGAGPTAVWRFDQRPTPGAAGLPGGLDWAVVDCATGQPLGPVQAARAPLASPPPTEAYAEAPSPMQPPMAPYARPTPAPFPAPGAYAQGPAFGAQPPAAPPHMPPLVQPSPSPFPAPGPYAQGPAFGPQPPAMPGPLTAPSPGFGAPPFAFPPAPPAMPQPRPAPRWFGDRYLTWPGKV